jgi:hypothetical protein
MALAVLSITLGACGSGSETSNKPPDSAPPTVPGGLQATSSLPTQVSISWTASADEPSGSATGVGGYYIYRDGVMNTPIATVTSGTSYTDKGLTSGTTYRYQVAAFDRTTPRHNVSAASGPLSVTTPRDTDPPTVPTGLSASAVTASTVTLNWMASTDEPNPGGTGVGGYYVYRNAGTTPIATITNGTSHTDTGLAASTVYQYQVAAFDRESPANASARSTAVTATTTASAGDTQPPTVPTGLHASSVLLTQVTISWAASADLPNPGGSGIGGYYIYRNGNTTTAIATVTTGTAYTDSGLLANTAYTYQVAAFDQAAPKPNVSAPSNPLAVTTAKDTQAPSVPAGLAASGVTVSAVTISWSPATDLPNPGGTGIGGYNVYRNGNTATPVATVTSSTTYTDTGLIGGTAYQYQVAAFDRAQPANVSAPSGAVTATTSPVTVPPSVPGGLKASAVTVSTITLTWNASTDTTPGAPGVGGYNVYRNGNTATPIATVTSGTTYTDTGLIGGTAYQYQVAAFDRAQPANVSAPSGAVTATTSPVTVPPSVPTGLKASAVTVSTITLTWNASTDATPGGPGVGGYYLYRNGNTATPVASVTGTAYTDTGLTASTSYQYQVAAFDKATPPNVSAPSASVTATTSASGSVTVTVSPRRAGLTTSQSQIFVATVSGTVNTSVTWSVDGVDGGNSTIGTITSGGLYTPPSSGGVHSITATSVANSSGSGTSTAAVTDLAGIYTHHVDVARTGQNLKEYALTPAIVGGAGNFGRLFTCAVDGPMYAHPLYVANLSIGGGTHNVVFLATENDSVYAIDADSSACVIYWQKSFINGSTVLTVPQDNSTGFAGNVGITGTPVINPALGTMYVVVMTKEIGAGNSVSYHHRLHALGLATGSEAAGSPVDVTGSVASQSGTVQFDSSVQNQRAALLLSGYASGTAVYIAFASFGDIGNWYGWVMSYDASSLHQIAVWNAAPNGSAGGIWMSGGGIAADSSGGLFFSTGNGTFDDKADIIPPMAPGNDFGESYVKLNPTTLNVTDFYTPSQNFYWTGGDLDISSSGLVVLPDGLGPTGHPNLLAGSDKQGHFWLIDRDAMSRFSPSSDNTVQYLQLPNVSACGVECVYSTPAYWNGTIYVAVNAAQLMAIPLVSGLVPASAGVVTPSSMSAETYKYPAPTPSVSALTSNNAIVWALETNANGTGNQSGFSGPAILRAYDATNLGHTLYSSTASANDKAGNAVKFQAPVVANGKVYVAGDHALTVYGLLP